MSDDITKKLFSLDAIKSRSKKQERDTLGSINNQLSSSVEYFQDFEDMIQQMNDPIKLEEQLWNLVDAYKKKYPKRDGFIELNTMRDKLMPRWAKRIWAARYSCPDPWFDQSVWHYHHTDDSLEYLWTLPDPETCKLYLQHENTIVPEEQWLLKHIQDCKSGALEKLVKHLNGEKPDSVHILLNEVPQNLIIES